MSKAPAATPPTPLIDIPERRHAHVSSAFRPSFLPSRLAAHAGFPGGGRAADRRRRGGRGAGAIAGLQSGWFADKGAAQSAVQRSGRLPDGSLAGVSNASQQQAQSRQQLQRSLDNLNRTAAAVAAQQAAQAAARAAAAANGAGVPDGLTPGGLWAAEGAQANGKAPRRRRRARPMAARS